MKVRSMTKVPIIRLRPACLEEMEEVAKLEEVHEVVGCLVDANKIGSVGMKYGKKIPVHIALDHGMNRMELHYPEQHSELSDILEVKNLDVRGLMTHFPNADDHSFEETITEIDEFLNNWKLISDGKLLFHIANSATAFRLYCDNQMHEKYSQLESHPSMVRIGIASYGLEPSNHVQLLPKMKPVMRFVSKIIEIVQDNSLNKPRLALIGGGMLNNFIFKNSHALIKGRRYPVHSISDNYLKVDITQTKDNINPGDEVVLLGKQGNEEITATEIAEKK